MNAGMFLMSNTGELVEMRESPYDSEAQLQKWLAAHPSLLSGHQVDPDSPRRWLLVRREAGVPGEEDGGDRWSVDHLFLDQDGIPTLIEVKRSSDTRLRREVVGQMMDYAANALVYWPAQTIRDMFEARCTKEEIDPGECLAAHLGDDVDASQFWTKVDTNLRAGKVRLVFVADVIPRELQRVVEFLNSQMHPAEVLAVEVRRFEGPPGTPMRTIVPRVIGHTADADQRKKPTTAIKKDQITPDELLDRLEEVCGPIGRAHATRVMQWAESHRLTPKATHRLISFMAPDSSGERHRLVSLCYETMRNPPEALLILKKAVWQRRGFFTEDQLRVLIQGINSASGGKLHGADAETLFIRLNEVDTAQLERVLAVLEGAIPLIAKH